MTEKPRYGSGYSAGQTDLVQRACRHVATILGDLMGHIVIVGSLVPTLLIPQDASDERDLHVGSRDLDLGFSLGVLEGTRYQQISSRLRRGGFEPAVNADGEQQRQRWRFVDGDMEITIDFLIPPPDDRAEGGSQQDLESDFAAVVTPGLDLAFRAPVSIRLTGPTLLDGERAKRDVRICNAGAFIVLKSLAFDVRGENKDAYDLWYIVRYYGEGVGDVARKLSRLTDSQHTERALQILTRDFTTVDAPGPRRAAEFLFEGPDEDTQADVVADIVALLGECD